MNFNMRHVQMQSYTISLVDQTIISHSPTSGVLSVYKKRVQDQECISQALEKRAWFFLQGQKKTNLSSIRTLVGAFSDLRIVQKHTA